MASSPGFPAWLERHDTSIAFSTYQTSRLFLVGRKGPGALSVLERLFDHAMGIGATAQTLWLGTRYHLWRFENQLTAGEEHEGCDRLFVPRGCHLTGSLDVHDVALTATGEPAFVSTAYSCIAAPSERYSFRPLWRPPFVTDLVPEDRCHLNGLAMDAGLPRFVTLCGAFDTPQGWRTARTGGGLVMEVPSGEVVASGLSMPHSPRMRDGRLWLLNSGAGELGHLDEARGEFVPLVFLPGYLRGLAFAGDHAIVGLSKCREHRTFSGLPLDDRLRERGREAVCGIMIVHLATGKVEEWLLLDGVVTELYDVAALPGVRRPHALSFKNDDAANLIAIEVRESPGKRADLIRQVPDSSSGGPAV